MPEKQVEKLQKHYLTMQKTDLPGQKGILQGFKKTGRLTYLEPEVSLQKE